MVEVRAMATLSTLDWRRVIAQGIVAGIIGGILIDAFLYVTLLRPAHQPFIVLWQSISATATATSIASPVLGFAIHFCISIAWGVGYAYVAYTRDAVAAHPYISGLVYGFIVMVLMQLVQMAASVQLPPMTAAVFLGSLIAYCVFFGLPIAVYISRALRT